MENAVQVAQSFYLHSDTPTSGELLIGMDIITMMRLIPFGKRMVVQAQEQADEFKLLGRELELNIVDDDIKRIKKNLSSLTKAYGFAMN